MTLPPLTPDLMVLVILFSGLLLLLGIIFPVQLSAKLRRMAKARTHRTCRICGYRFLLREKEAEVICPHCGAKN